MRRVPFVATTLTLAALLLPTAAGAATAGKHPRDGGRCSRDGSCDPDLRFVAAAGEANRVDVARTPGGFTVHDGGAPLTAGPGCVLVDAQTASCSAPVMTLFEVLTGDGDDTVTGAPGRVDLGDGDDRFTGAGVVYGGSGRDELRIDAGDARFAGGPGDDVLVGGAGADQLDGGSGRDTLRGEGGDDELQAADADTRFGIASSTAAPPSADTIDGGPGRDVLGYASSPAGVVVDLADDRPEGRPGEGDVVVGIEDVAGTPFPDRLVGDDGPNRMRGNGGADVVAGRGGDDRLSGGYVDGRVTLLGGDGDDVLSVDGAAALLDGGAGDDRLENPSPARPQRTPLRCGPGTDLAVQP